MKLGVNIDHIATLRQARRGDEPDPFSAVKICEKAGADSIVVHLREDRRHIQDADVFKIRKAVRIRFNLEMSIAPGIVAIALKVKPDQVTFVPERRQEITTEGGLDVAKYKVQIKNVFQKMSKAKIVTSVFIAPEQKQIDTSYQIGIRMVEFHTGSYAHAKNKTNELRRLSEMTRYASYLGITVNAGHGLNYENAKAVARIPQMEELNIGHSIISRAVFVGLDQAVRDMKRLIS